MFHIKQFNEKIILDEAQLQLLRHSIDSNVEDGAIQNSDPMAFAQSLDAYLSDHLRGMEFPIKKQVKIALYETHFAPGLFIPITYYHVAQILLNLQLPSKQFISNFQNWILMSTEFTVDFNDVLEIYRDLKEDSIAIHSPAESYFDIEPESTLSSNAAPLLFEDEHEDTNPSEMSLPSLLNEDEDEIEDKHTNQTSEPTFEHELTSAERPSKVYKIKHKTVMLYVLGIGVFLSGLRFVYNQTFISSEVSFRDACILLNKVSERPVELTQTVSFVYENSKPGYPKNLSFTAVNKERLRGYLKRNNSLLAEEPYFSKIMDACAKNNIHPALLFAIAGQEQGFVKRGSENAALIVNNPFNVYHSWVEYNTNITDSATIASITVRNILADRPSDENAFQWLNKTYAEDKNWWVGTERIFFSIETYIEK